ncbi:hypothetical protein FBU31_001101 [Coemansia sp. 'formosensis']|nr:hypothetical protein FBU31_001101 [Coemansia sp. 'formosensis']
MSVFNQFYPSPSSSDVCASASTFTHDSNLTILPTATSHIAGHANSAVFAYRGRADTLCRIPVNQLFTADGRLFLEYQPGHNVIFIDNQIDASQTLQHALQGACLRKKPLQTTGGGVRKRRPKAGRSIAVAGMPKKPHNAFIRYRCHHLEDTKLAHPEASQTELSQIIAEHWRNESSETKELFQAEYQDELRLYHVNVRQLQAQHPFGDLV